MAQEITCAGFDQARGKVKRVLIILGLMLLGVCPRSYAQLGAIDGQLRYEHSYRDYDFGGNLAKIIIKNPILNLRMRGNILSKRIMSYSLSSSIRANYITTENAVYSYSASQYSWNRYNLVLKALPYAPVKLTLGFRENSYDLISKGDFSTDKTADREQEQRADLSVHQIPGLPTLTLSYVRNRSFSTMGFPYDVMNQTLTFGASGAMDTTGAYGFNASMVDLRDERTRAFNRFFTMDFSATRALSDKHGVNLNAEFEKYIGYSVVGSSIQYSGVMTKSLRTRTSVAGSSALSSNVQTRSVSFSQSASYRIDENYSTGLGVTGFLGRSAVGTHGEGRTDLYKSWGTSGNIQHRRSISRMTITNVLILGYNEQRYTSTFHTFNMSLANAITRPIGRFTLNGHYNLAYVRVRNYSSYNIVDNTAGVTFGGMLTRIIQTQSDLRYRDSRYPGDVTPYRDQRSIFFTQRLDGSFVYRIPFTLSLHVSSNWYLVGLKGHTYGWRLSYMSPAFFLKGLSLSYAYSRSYDPYYDREVPEHNGSMSYRWRALSFGARFRISTFPINTRELQLTVARPF
jgi:hypothetical protein